jgi:hypothetical protein
MPQTSPQTAAPALSPAAVRVVLFGMPDAGKSSLLGALAQAAQTQEHVLNGRLVDPTAGLADLQRRLYEDRPRETLEEIVPYPVRLQPYAAPGKADGRAALEAVLIDCDGRVANELLSHQKYLRPDSSLARAILEADTLVLVVDASANPAHLERDFAQFGRFLGLLEKSRARRSDVGGLPVYLVLTKCDLVAQKGDTTVTWIDRIEERKRQVGLRFQEFLNRRSDHEPVPFGSIELHLWATAVKRPALADAPARPREPYGVGELFRQCLESADHYQKREDRAGARLQWTLLGSLGLLVLLGGLAVTLYLTQPGAKYNPLEGKVETYFSEIETQTPRQRQRNLGKNIRELQAIVADTTFATLPRETQQRVRDSLRKMEAYRRAYAAFEEKLRQIDKADEARDESDLRGIARKLQALEPPRRFESGWEETDAGREWVARRKDVRAIERAVAQAKQLYDRVSREGNRLLKDLEQGKLTIPKAKGAANNLIKEVEGQDRKKETGKKVPGSATVTYAKVDNFPTVKPLRQAWEQVRDSLENVPGLVDDKLKKKKT